MNHIDKFQNELYAIVKKNKKQDYYNSNAFIFDLGSSKEIVSLLLKKEREYDIDLIGYLHHTDFTVSYIFSLLRRQLWTLYRKGGKRNYYKKITTRGNTQKDVNIFEIYTNCIFPHLNSDRNEYVQHKLYEDGIRETMPEVRLVNSSENITMPRRIYRTQRIIPTPPQPYYEISNNIQGMTAEVIIDELIRPEHLELINISTEQEEGRNDSF